MSILQVYICYFKEELSTQENFTKGYFYFYSAFPFGIKATKSNLILLCCDLKMRKQCLINSWVKRLHKFIIDPSQDLKPGKNSGKGTCKQSNLHLIILMGGCYLLNFHEIPKGDGDQTATFLQIVWEDLILRHCRSPSWKGL